MSDLNDDMCTCSVVRLGGRVHNVPSPSCRVHGDIKARATKDEATRKMLENLWDDAYKAGWRDRNRSAIGLHNRPETPNPYRKVSE